MKRFNQFVETIKDQEPKKSIDKEVDDQKDSEIGEWVKTTNGWHIVFNIGGQKYVISFSPLDEQEKHWKFVYYIDGQRESSDIKKFGEVSEWVNIWKSLIDILKDFIRIFNPLTVKFIGMSSSKRQVYYRDLFKAYVDNYRHAFKKLGYICSFDDRKLHEAPSMVIKKNHHQTVKKEIEDKEVNNEKSE